MTNNERKDGAAKTTTYNPAQRSLTSDRDGRWIAQELRLLLDTHRVVYVDMGSVKGMSSDFANAMVNELTAGLSKGRPGWMATSCLWFINFTSVEHGERVRSAIVQYGVPIFHIVTGAFGFSDE